MMGADELDQCLPMTFANRSLFISSLTDWFAIRYGFCNTGSEAPVSIVISVRGVAAMDVLSCAN